jgi:PHD/YefM family antitoxin component YafN of YafNO toxin-antitoxin module
MPEESAPDFQHYSGDEMAELLSRIPGAAERIEAGIADARSGRVIPLLTDDASDE